MAHRLTKAEKLFADRPGKQWSDGAAASAEHIRRVIAEGIAAAHVAPCFTRGFDSYACNGDSIETHYSGFRICARIEFDQDSKIGDDDCYPLEFDPEMFETREQHANALEVRRAWERDEWFFCGIVLSVTCDGVMLDEHAASLWGIECNYPDSDNSYLTVVAQELLPEAIESGRKMLARLQENRANALGVMLEELIDAQGLASVLETIAGICAEKAQHIRTSYGDLTLSKTWDKAADRVQVCADSQAVQQVQP